MKHLHLLMVLVIISLFIYQCYTVMPPRQPIKKPVKIITHISYALVILTGGWMLIQLMSVNAPVQWVFAKIILLIAAISASIKAFRATATPAQSKAGMFIAAIAYVGIITLAVIKPDNFI